MSQPGSVGQPGPVEQPGSVEQSVPEEQPSDPESSEKQVKVQYKQDTSLVIRTICPECREDPPNIIEQYSSGEVVCGSCGLVLEYCLIDTRPEWRTFGSDAETNREDPNRCGDGENPLLTGGEYATRVGEGSEESRALGRVQERSNKNPVDARLLEAYSKIETWCARSMTKMITDAAKHYVMLCITNNWITSAEDVSGLAVCIFLACRKVQLDRTLKEICQLTRLEHKTLRKRLGQLLRKMGSHSVELEESRQNGEISAPVSSISVVPTYNSTASGGIHALMPRWCKQLGLEPGCHWIGGRLAMALDDTLTLGARGASTIGGAVIYVVCCLVNKEVSYSEVGDMCGVSPGTLRNAINLMVKDRDEILNNRYFPRGPGIDPERFPGGLKANLTPARKKRKTVILDSGPAETKKPGPENNKHKQNVKTTGTKRKAVDIGPEIDGTRNPGTANKIPKKDMRSNPEVDYAISDDYLANREIRERNKTLEWFLHH